MTIKQLAKKYSKYVESYEFDDEVTEEEGKANYWVYLKEPYETWYGTTSIHDNLETISNELADIKLKYKEEEK